MHEWKRWRRVAFHGEIVVDEPREQVEEMGCKCENGDDGDWITEWRGSSE